VPKAALVGIALTLACSSVEVNPHQGDSDYYYNYVYAPPRPQMDSLVAGDRKILVYFTPGGGDRFYATCSVVATGGYGRTGTSAKSPTPVDSLQNGVEYRCGVTAFNSSRPSPTSAYLTATPKSP
jgi:hypothetical protein